MKKLIEKFIRKECSNDEINKIITYFDLSNNLQDFPSLEEVSDITSSYPEMEEKTADKIFNKIIKNSEPIKLVYWKSRSFIRKVSVAAAIAVIAVSAYIFSLDNNKEIINPIQLVETEITPGFEKAKLTLANGSELTIEKGNDIKTNNAISNGEQLIYAKAIESSQRIEYNYLTIPRGGEFKVELADGTIVWLNSETRLKYPVSFLVGQDRIVELVYGEAYFDVSPSTEHNGAKFIVQNQNQEIEVLGTEFNIKAYQGESNILTTLVEGKVAINAGENSKILKPSEQSNLDINNNDIQIYEVNVYNEISWKDGVFAFESKPLIEISKVLSRWYDVDFVFENKAYETEKFNGILRKNAEIVGVLETIKGFGIIENYEINGKTIILK